MVRRSRRPAGEIATGSRGHTARSLGATLLIAAALVGCGSHGAVGYDGEPIPPELPATTGTVSTGDGSSEAPWGSPETDPDCGCDGADDGTDGTASDGTDSGGFDGSGDASGDSGDSLRLPPDQGRSGSSRALVLQLDATASGAGCVHGILADEDGRRISGATVSAASIAGAGGEGTAVTTRRGHFCIHAALARAQRCVEVGTVVPSGP